MRNEPMVSFQASFQWLRRVGPERLGRLDDDTSGGLHLDDDGLGTEREVVGGGGRQLDRLAAEAHEHLAGATGARPA